MKSEELISLLRKVGSLGPGEIHFEPLTDNVLDRFEQIHQVPLPAELKALFKICNGVNLYPGGLLPLFSQEKGVSIDWYFKEFPDWKSRGWIPIGDDGCGDHYVLLTSTHRPLRPVVFIDQSDTEKPDYIVASGLWKFLFFLLNNEILVNAGSGRYWPFDKEKVVTIDPEILACSGAASFAWETQCRGCLRPIKRGL